MNRIVSLLPAATEIVAALGALPELVGVSHECDCPDEVRSLPRVTTTPIDPDQSGIDIDRAVRSLGAAGQPVIALNAERLKALRPTHIVTQALCEVCAVANGQAVRLATILDPPPTVINLGGRTLEGVWRSIAEVADSLGRVEQGRELVEGLRARIAALSAGVATLPRRVLCIEWLEPAFTAGHWVPDMVSAAGGVDIGALAGDHSAERSWSVLHALQPDIVIVMLCGMDVSRSKVELSRLADPDALALLGSVPVWVLDANAYSSRPGPRLADGAERLAAAFRGDPMPGLVPWNRGP